MSDSTEDLHQELQAAQRTIASLQEQIEKRESTYRLTTLELEESHSALLFMLEDLEAGRKKIERAHQEWITALDAVNDPIFLHDKNFRILRCNKAYQQCAGIPFGKIIGQPYYEVFPKTGAPLPYCLRVMEKTEAATDEEEMTFGDTTYRSRTFSVYSEEGTYLHSVHILEDVTEHKRTEEEIRATRDLLKSVVENAPVRIFWKDASLRYIGCNTAFARDAGLERPEQLIGKDDYQMGWREQAELYRADDRRVMNADTPKLDFDEPQTTPDDRTIWLRTSKVPMHDASGKVNAVLGIYQDITERKEAEEALRESEEKYRSIYDNAQVGLYRTRISDGKLLMANDAMARMFGFDSIEEATAKYITSEHYVDSGAREVLLSTLQKYGRFDNFEACLTRNDGMIRWFQYSGRLVQNKGYIDGVATDITERKEAEQELKDLSVRQRHILASTPAVHYACRIDGEHFVPAYASPNLRDFWGYDPEEYLGNTEWWWSGIHPEERDSIAGAFRTAVMASGRSHYAHEYRFRHKDGVYRWIHDELQIIRDHAGQPLEIVGSWLDITERKQAEAAIQHANRALATLSSVDHNLVHASDENELLQAICQVIVEQKGCRMAWVGYVQHDESKSIRIMSRAGYDAGYLDSMRLTWAETERGMGPSGRAVRSGATQLCQDIANDPHYLPWRDAAIERGYAASIALPLTNGEVFGILHVYSAVVNDFTPNEITLLEEMAGDLAFGVRALLIRRERDLALEQNQQHLEKLRNSLEDTVRAIASIAEMRDPYTAGHQARVADLAAAIAKQMGLPEDQVHAIHLAGTVHDLGKIKVPAEILSKPGKIDDLEFGLIKVHAQAGYDILKNISFPWPIAQMVLQHHERLDGSGYPQGLKGEAILLEARILSVADMVEAMTSHRPYRPGFGIDVALEEITRQRGIRYDPQAVDACLALFRERGYRFK